MISDSEVDVIGETPKQFVQQLMHDAETNDDPLPTLTTPTTLPETPLTSVGSSQVRVGVRVRPAPALALAPSPSPSPSPMATLTK